MPAVSIPSDANSKLLHRDLAYLSSSNRTNTLLTGKNLMTRLTSFMLALAPWNAFQLWFEGSHIGVRERDGRSGYRPNREMMELGKRGEITMRHVAYPPVPPWWKCDMRTCSARIVDAKQPVRMKTYLVDTGACIQSG